MKIITGVDHVKKLISFHIYVVLMQRKKLGLYRIKYKKVSGVEIKRGKKQQFIFCFQMLQRPLNVGEVILLKATYD